MSGNAAMPPHLRPPGLLRAVDSVQLPVPDLDQGLAFYRDRLGQELLWRSRTAAGLRLPDGEGELVLQLRRPQPEIDFLVDSVDQAVARLVAAGARVLADPFGNPLTVVDLSKGRYRTDPDGTVTGVAPPAPPE